MIRSWAADTLDIAIKVTFEEGSQITSLTGGAVVAHAVRAGAAMVAGIASITATDTARVLFAPGSLSVGVWQLQVRATVAGVVQTIVDTPMTIQTSI